MVTVYEAPPPAVPPTLFDRPLVRARRDRAAAGFEHFSFLHERVLDEIIERLGAINRHFGRVLDLGCHTGLLARREQFATIIQADPSPAMAARAGGLALAADEEWLPFREEWFDLVISVLSLHSVNDLPGSLIQINRSLKPDGLFVGALFGGETLTELRQAFAKAEEEFGLEPSPRVAPFADVRDAGGLLQRAGFALPVTDSDRITVRYAHPLKLLADLRGMGVTNALTIRPRTPLRRDLLMAACAHYQDLFCDPDGPVRATFEIITLTGWAPHESQQKPLRPGSARHRLADALGTRERSAGERVDGAPASENED